MGSSDTLLNAGIGAAVTVLLSFVGVSGVLGGGVAGYLQRETRADGAKVGALSGVLATVPLLFGVAFLYVVVLAGATHGVPAGPGVLLLAVLVIPLGLLWNAGLGALGGYLGTYAYEEYDGRRDVA